MTSTLLPSYPCSRSSRIKGEFGQLLRDCGLDAGRLDQAITKLHRGEPVTDPNAEQNRQALKRYTDDLIQRTSIQCN